MDSALCLLVAVCLMMNSCQRSHGYDYCQDENLGHKKLFCMGVDGQILDFGAGFGCLFDPTCSIIISGRRLYRNSTWFKVYLSESGDSFRTDVWFIVSKKSVKVGRDSDAIRGLGVRDTMIAKGEVIHGRDINVYSYRMSENRKFITSSNFFSFSPDRRSSQVRGAFGQKNFTVFSWRASEFLTESGETFNFHRTAVQITVRVITRSLSEEKETVIQTVPHMIFEDARQQQPSGLIRLSVRSREEL